MKCTVMLLLCSLSVTWQQNFYRRPPYYWPPRFPANYWPMAPRPIDQFSPSSDGLDQGQRWSQNAFLISLLKIALEQNENEKATQVDSSIEARFNPLTLMKVNKNKEDAPEDRAFGLGFLGLNALANYAANSISLTTTSTTYSTSTSTITIGTLVTCFTRTLFTSTTACRRKRKLLPGLLIGDGQVADSPIKLEPSQVFAIEPSMDDIDIIMREGKSFADELKQFIQSSKQEPDAVAADSIYMDPHASPSPRLFGLGAAYGADILDNLEGTLYVSTATVTSFSLYTSSVTKTVTNIAGAASLSCLPACFTLC